MLDLAACSAFISSSSKRSAWLVALQAFEVIGRAAVRVVPGRFEVSEGWGRGWVFATKLTQKIMVGDENWVALEGQDVLQRWVQREAFS